MGEYLHPISGSHLGGPEMHDHQWTRIELHRPHQPGTVPKPALEIFPKTVVQMRLCQQGAAIVRIAIDEGVC